MKKFLTFIAILLLIVIAGVYTLAFTGFGNSLAKPYIEKIAKEKTGYDLKLSKFDLNFGSLDVVADIDSNITAHAKGNYSIFNQSFDLVYDINAKDLQRFGIKLDEPMMVAGQVRGKAKDFSINGVGNMLDSNVRFLANIKDFKPFNVDLDAKGLNVTKALALAKQKPYMSGEINAVANIKNGVGEANITSSNLIVNKEAAKDFNITIPNSIPVDVKSDITYQNSTVIAASNILSDILNLEAKETVYNLDSKTLTSDFSAVIANLAKLEPFLKQKLNGSLGIKGAVKLVDNKPEFVDLNLTGFGGEVDAKLANNELNADISNLKIEELMGIVAMPKAVNGVINGTAKVQNLDNVSNIKGGANLKITNGKISPKELKKLANVDFPEKNSFELNSDTNIEGGVIKTISSLNSNLLNIPSVNATYNLANKNLDATFSAVVDDLSKLKEFTKKTLKGSLKADGNAKMSGGKLSLLNASIDTLGGNITAKSNGANLEAKISSLDIGDIFALIGQTPLASGKIEAAFNLTSIDPKNLNGVGNIDINSGVFNHTEVSKLIKKDFPNGVKFDANNKLNFVNSVVNFDSIINSDIAKISSLKGSYDLNSATISGDYVTEVSDLNRLKFLTNKSLNGGIVLNGTFKKSGENLTATANSDLFNGKLAATMNNEKIIATFDKFQIPELTHMLDFGRFYEGVGDLQFHYDTKKESGDFNVDINQGRLTRSNLTDAVSLLTQRDITQQIFNDSYVKGVINTGLITFDSMMKAPKMDLNVTKGTLDTKSSKINIPVALNIEKTDLSAKITGTTKNPKVDVSSKYLEQKLDKAIGKGLDKILGTPTDSNQTNEQRLDNVIDKGLNKLLGIEEKPTSKPITPDTTSTTPAQDTATATEPATTKPVAPEEPKNDKEILRDSAKELLKGLF